MLIDIALPPHASHITETVFAPDGAHVAIATDRGLVVAATATGAARVVAKGHIDHVAWAGRGLVAVDAKRVRAIAIPGVALPERRGAVVGRLSNSELVLFDAAGKPVATHPHGGWCLAIAGEVAAIGDREGVAIVDLASGAIRTRHSIGPATRLALSPSGARLVACGHDSTWEGPIGGPLAWYPETGLVSHAGTRFAIGGAIFEGERLIAWASGDAILDPAGEQLCLVDSNSAQLASVAELAEPIVGATAPVTALAVDRSRGLLAACDHHGWVCIWRLADATLVHALRVARREQPIAWLPDGALLVGASRWDLAAGTRRAIDAGIGSIEHVSVAGDSIAVGAYQRVARLDRALNVTARYGPWDDKRVEAIALAPDGTVYVARDRIPVLALALDGTERELPAANRVVAGAGFVALGGWEGSELIAGGEREPIDRFEAGAAVGDALLWIEGSQIGSRALHDVRMHRRLHDATATIAAADRAFYTSGNAMWIAEREYTEGTLQRVLGTTAGGKITSLAFDPSGEQLAIGEYDGRIHVWSLDRRRTPFGSAARPGKAGACGRPRRIGLLDGTSLQPAGTIREPGRVGEVSSIAFPGALVACASQVMRWDGDLSAIGTTEPAVVDSGRLVSRDGSRLISVGSWGGEPAVVYDVDGTERAKLADVDARDRFSAISDDGSRVLLAGAFGDTSQITVYAASGERIGTLRVDARINGALFDHTGCVLGWTLERGPAFRWDPAAQRLERWGAGDFDRYASAHATGGGLIALATRTVVDVRDAAGACRLRIADQEPSALALSDDGTRLAIGHWTGRVRVLDLDPLRELATLCTTCEGGWWVRDADGFAHEPGRKEWA